MYKIIRTNERRRLLKLVNARWKYFQFFLNILIQTQELSNHESRQWKCCYATLFSPRHGQLMWLCCEHTDLTENCCDEFLMTAREFV